MPDDAELLRRYTVDRSETAFAEFVQRHLDFVYGVALPQVGGDAHHAADVAQYVFTQVAWNAAALAHCHVCKGWLYTTAHRAAANVVRADRRRRQREEIGHAMNELAHDPAADAAATHLQPAIDRALSALNARERDAVFLRYFEGREYPEIGTRLALSPDGARRRVERALEKMRRTLARSGIVSTAAALSGALATKAAGTAPAGLAVAVTDAALASAASAGAWSAVLHFLLMSKIKTGLAVAVVLAGLATGVVEVRAHRELNAELAQLMAAHRTAAQREDEDRRLSAALTQQTAGNPDAAELARIRARIARLEARPAGFRESELKLMSTWRNRGHATADAALETLFWAAAHRDTDALASACYFDGQWKPLLDSWFAGLSEAVRAKFGSPERLLAARVGEYLIGGYHAESASDGSVAAVQLIRQPDQEFSQELEPGRVMLSDWEVLASGQERGNHLPFHHDAAGWQFDGGFRTGAEWKQFVFDKIDPATGEWRPTRKQARSLTPE